MSNQTQMCILLWYNSRNPKKLAGLHETSLLACKNLHFQNGAQNGKKWPDPGFFSKTKKNMWSVFTISDLILQIET
jgi:hypothetical protein